MLSEGLARRRGCGAKAVRSAAERSAAVRSTAQHGTAHMLAKSRTTTGSR